METDEQIQSARNRFVTAYLATFPARDFRFYSSKESEQPFWHVLCQRDPDDELNSMYCIPYLSFAFSHNISATLAVSHILNPQYPTVLINFFNLKAGVLKAHNAQSKVFVAVLS